MEQSELSSFIISKEGDKTSCSAATIPKSLPRLSAKRAAVQFAKIVLSK
jgi:hypothetical protein